MYILRYEVKGVDYWWVLLDGDRLLGSGIVPELQWNEFISIFTCADNVMNIKLERIR